MKVVEKTGRTVDEAVESCLLELGAEKDQVSIEILEEPGRKGLFGLFGQKPARVRVIYNADPSSIACKFLRELIAAMNVNADFEVFIGTIIF
jgi:spoIIIJ-associated protein